MELELSRIIINTVLADVPFWLLLLLLRARAGPRSSVGLFVLQEKELPVERGLEGREAIRPTPRKQKDGTDREDGGGLAGNCHGVTGPL